MIIERVVYYSQFPRGGSTPCCARPHRKAAGSVRRQKEQKSNMGKSLYYGFHRKGKGEAGHTGLGLARVNDFSGLWCIRAAPIVWHLSLLIRAA